MGVAGGDTDRHIRSAFCRSDIEVWREVYCACLASWRPVAVTARALASMSSDLLVRQPEGNRSESPQNVMWSRETVFGDGDAQLSAGRSEAA